jgi:cobalt-zinc-cadmium efflux system protein
MLAVALVGVAVNLAATLMIARAGRPGPADTPARRGETGDPPGSSQVKPGFHLVSGQPRSLNLAGAFRHILTDLYAFIATAVAGVIIIVTGFARADAIATLVVVALMVYAGYGLIRDSGRIFLEAAPAGLSPAAVGAAMAGRPDVCEVHDLHIWEITSGMPAASAHVLVTPGVDCHAVRADLEAFLSSQYGISHATLQVDHATIRAGNVNGSAPQAPGITAGESHCEDAHGPVYRPGDA